VKGSGRRASVLAPLVVATLVGGCFSSGGGTPDSGNQTCNAIPFGNAFVELTDSGNATVPAATGGALTDGSYHLTSSTYYPSIAASTACTADPIATNLVISSSSTTTGTMQTATVTSAGHFLVESTTYLINDTSLTVRIDCISPGPPSLAGNVFQSPYSAAPTELQLYGSGDCGSHIEIYDLD